MKTSKPTITLLALLAFFVLCGGFTAVQAVSQKVDALHLRHGYFLRIIDFMLDLDLTPEQRSDLQAIFSESRDTLRPLLSDMHELRSEMDETFLGEEIDTAKASSQIEEMSSLKAQITTAGLNAMLQAALILTPQQRQIIINARDKWKNCFLRVRNLVMSLFGEGPVD